MKTSKVSFGIAIAVLALALQVGPAIAVESATDVARYCKEDPVNPDPQASELRQQVSNALRAFPANYMVNVCVYRESVAFVGGSPGSLVATLDAENVQGLPTQVHPAPGSIACGPSSTDAPCVRVSQVRAFLSGVHLEAVRLPGDPGNNNARIVAIVQDVGN